jgi:hypothetical protein
MSPAAAHQKSFIFDDAFETDKSHRTLSDPSSYKGLYAFHKYWGKKPHEVLGFIIDHLTEPGDIVLDPFMGSGTSGRETLLRARRFIGCDLNPSSVLLTEMILSPPAQSTVVAALSSIRDECRELIYDSYLTRGRRVATHYLWNELALQEVWVNGKGPGGTKEVPSAEDVSLVEKFSEYETTQLRPLQFFTNARINSSTDLTWRSIFTGRALRNLDIVRSAILAQPEPVRNVLLLILTASCGQMSRMVFAISGRGKTQGKSSDRIEVGSWVIGFWRPRLHFECNVWDCFERRANKLIQAIQTQDPLYRSALSKSPIDVLGGDSAASVQETDCRKLIASLPNESVTLIVTDPPHSDRIPYLELSEIWNALLGKQPCFLDELVVSNAKERNKSKQHYSSELASALGMMARVLRPNGFLVLVFNARSAEDWSGLTEHMSTGTQNMGLRYAGRFPVNYSAGSVVQDNRPGGLKYDYAMVFTKESGVYSEVSVQINRLRLIPRWEGASDRR